MILFKTTKKIMKNPRKIQKGSESMNEKDEKKAPQTFSVRTDLAIEARELAQKDTTDTLEGVAGGNG